MSPEIKFVKLDQIFQRTSGFYYDERNERWFEKICTLSLGHYLNGKRLKIGSVTINLSDFVDKGEVKKFY
jgi:hypothetical protein